MANSDPRLARADRLASMIVRQRDLRCRRCDVPMNYNDLTAHHLIKRRYRKTRWMLENLVSVCWICHEWLEKNPYANEQFAISILGEDRYAELQGLARDTRSKVDIDAVLSDLKGLAA